MEILNLAIIAILAMTINTFAGYKIYQIFQLSSYRVKGVFNWLLATRFDYLIRYFALAFFPFVSMLVYISCFWQFYIVEYIGILFYFLFAGLFSALTIREKKKTPLKLTKRAMRFIIVSAVLNFFLIFALLIASRHIPIGYSIISIALLLIPLTICIAHFIILPFEILNNSGYKRRAIKCLNSYPNLIKIGITGSYGKTTAKNILAKMLEKKYKVLYSPASYNTPMGLSKVINSELNMQHNVFIAEMGARYMGDIKELCDMIQPNYGLITSIGTQHLETFGSQQAIFDTKFELIENLAVGGVGVFNGDSLLAVEMYKKCKSDKFLCAKSGMNDTFASYFDESISDKGTSFSLCIGKEVRQVSTVLLGKHIPGIITSCAALAHLMGVSFEDITEAIGQLEAVPHRLQLIEKNGAVILDDAYNSNPEGAKNALEILSKFDGIRVVVTPGLVELGEAEKPLNIQLGEHIAKNADYAVLVGANGTDIASGCLKDGIMSQEKVILVSDLDGAVEKIKEIAGKKVILFENDLPDNY